MKRDAAEILKAALALPSEDRAALIASLLESLETQGDENSDAAWATEIARRVAELEAGTFWMIPWSEVRNRFFDRTRHRALRRLHQGLDLQWVAGSREELHRR